jgi:hypothetical protein
VLFASGPDPCNGNEQLQDTTWLKQQIRNGRIWENRYGQISGHEYFLTEALCEGSVTVNGRVYNNLLLRYDIVNDDPVLMVHPDLFIILNREVAGEFTLVCQNREYRFVSFGETGYYLVLYNGKTKLLRKYVKTVKKQSFDNLYATFTEESTDYILSGGTFHPVRTRKDVVLALAGNEKEVRDFIRRNTPYRIAGIAGLLIPVLEYFDSISGVE